MPYAMPDIYHEVAEQRDKNFELWGGVSHDDTHHERDWIDFLEKQLDKASMALDVNKPEEYRQRLISIAALCLDAAESYDRKNK